jgi:hypothetical protein
MDHVLIMTNSMKLTKRRRDKRCFDAIWLYLLIVWFWWAVKLKLAWFGARFVACLNHWKTHHSQKVCSPHHFFIPFSNFPLLQSWYPSKLQLPKWNETKMCTLINQSPDLSSSNIQIVTILIHWFETQP